MSHLCLVLLKALLIYNRFTNSQIVNKNSPNSQQKTNKEINFDENETLSERGMKMYVFIEYWQVIYDSRYDINYGFKDTREIALMILGIIFFTYSILKVTCSNYAIISSARLNFEKFTKIP